MKRIVFLLFVLPVLCCFTVWGQPAGNFIIKGKANGSDGNPVQFGTVLVLSAADSSLAKGGVTDTTGVFEVPGLGPGTYRVSVSAVGYQKFTGEPVVLGAAGPVLDLGVITVPVDVQTLQEVVVTADRPVIERKMGTVILNVANPLFKTANSALDVMRRAPGLLVSPEGELSINGLYTPVVYIDGKQQPLSPEELRNLSASDIEQVEILTNASARFDGETRAVINIKLKRNATLGLQGNAYAGYLLNRRFGGYEAGASATYKTLKWVHYGRIGYYEGNNFLEISGRRIVRGPANQSVFDNAGLIKFTAMPLSYQYAADYTLNKNHQVGVFVKGTFRRERDRNDNQTLLTETAPETGDLLNQTTLQTNSVNQGRADHVAVDLNYKGTLNDRGGTLEAYLDYAYYDTDKSQDFRSDYLDREGNAVRPATVLTGLFPSNINIRAARVDFTQPFGNAFKVDAGAKVSWTTSNSDIRYDTLAGDAWVYDASRSNRFLYDEIISAGYVQLGKQFNKTSVEVGLRAENTDTRGNSLTLNEVVDRNYWRLLPSFQLQQDIGDAHSFTLGYARKLTRPTFYDLNPFTFYVDVFEYTEGNPFLLPITRNTAEMTYSFRDYSVGLTFINDRDVFAQMPIQDDATRIIRYTRVNLNTQNQLSLNFTIPYSLTKWWKTQHYLSGQYWQVKSDFLSDSFNNRAWTYYVEGSHVFSLPKHFSLELRYYYNAPGVSEIYRNGDYGAVSLGLQKSLFQDRGNLQINFADVFNTYREYFYGQYLNVDVSTLQKRNVQQATFRFSYRFGHSSFNRKHRNAGSAEEENRAK